MWVVEGLARAIVAGSLELFQSSRKISQRVNILFQFAFSFVFQEGFPSGRPEKKKVMGVAKLFLDQSVAGNLEV